MSGFFFPLSFPSYGLTRKTERYSVMCSVYRVALQLHTYRKSICVLCAAPSQTDQAQRRQYMMTCRQ